MRKGYTKPEMCVVTCMSEGVYMSSGGQEAADMTGSPVCQSKYMNGIWHKPTSGGQQAPVKERRGCEGCSADDGDGCKILKHGELNANGIFKPRWEQEGMSPDTLVW